MNKVSRLLCLCVALLLTATPASAREGEVTLAAVNAEWMLDVWDDPYSEDQDFPPKAREELDALAATLRELDADVVAFEELEAEGLLRAFVETYLADMGYEYVLVQPTNNGRGQNLGMISRLPIRSVTSYRFRKLTLPNDEGTWRFARDLMRVTLEIPSATGDAEAVPRELEVIVVHLKSKRDGEGDPQSRRWRLAEAVGLRAVVDDLLRDDPDRLIAAVGDFNDTPDSEPLRALTGGEDTHGPLTDAHASLDPEQRITFRNSRYRETIDFILTSPALSKRVGEAGVLETSGEVRGSDHSPVWAKFNIRD